ncbi:MAG: redox-regulated ATPase YchF [Kiritimatiellaeota bacterium]|nr:redox-regulated ATPase YchF [Kiritimatiellota bacterium]
MAGITCGIIGLPNVGKSSLFNALTRGGAAVASYPFCTIEPNVGVVPVPDARLARLNAVEKRPAAIPAAIEFVDVAGLVEGASHGEGRGNEFLEHIHHADALVHVVRCFRADDVAHVRADLSPEDDIRTINLELILADLQTAERALVRYRKHARGGEPEARASCVALGKLIPHLETEKPVRTAPLTPEDWGHLRELRFLTAKPVLYVANVDEDRLAAGLDGDLASRAAAFAAAEDSPVLPVCARLEAEIAELPVEEGAAFLAEMGLRETGLDRLIRACYRHLGLITFFTVGEKEVRAWTTRLGACAPEAGGVIHTDFRERFIRAEVIHFPDFERCGSRQAAREAGLMHVEGKEYAVRDGDILHFRIGR